MNQAFSNLIIPVNSGNFDILERVFDVIINSSIALTVSYVNGANELIVEANMEANRALKLARRRDAESVNWKLKKDSISPVWIGDNGENLGGYVSITKSLEETYDKPQVFLEKTVKYNHCVISPIEKWIDEILLKEDLTPSPLKKYKAIKNKINKYLITHKTGVPETELQKLCDDLNIKITIRHNLFGLSDSIYKSSKSGNPMKVFDFLNSTINHLHILTDKGKKMTKVVLDNQEELKQMAINLTEENEPFIYKETHNEIKQIKTTSTNYIINTPLGDYINEVKERYDLNKCELLIDSDVCRFIQEGSMTNNSIKQKKYFEIDKEYNNMSKFNVQHIDQIKAYYNFKECKYYCGFVKKITDFRACSEVMGNGYYYIKDIKIPEGNTTRICYLLEMFQYNGVYTKPELDWAKDRGIKYKIVAGAYGMSGELDFGLKGLNKIVIKQIGEKQTLGSFYALTTGIWASNKKTVDWTIDATPEYQKLLVKNKYDVRERRKKNTATVVLPKIGGRNLCQISGYIYAYQRLGLIAQLEEFEDIDNVVAIYVDGIYYVGNVNMLPTFDVKSMDSFDKLKFSNQFCSRSNEIEETWSWIPRKHYGVELFTGAGGTGKTHRNMMDTGLVNTCFCAPTHKLLASKQEEFGDRFKYATWAKLLCENPIAIRCINNCSVLLIDEVSMMTAVQQETLIEKYGDTMKIIFIGDVGYQARPVGNGYEFDTENKSIDNHVHLKKQYRTKDINLSNLIKTMRDCIDRMKGIDDILDNFQQITEEELTELYIVSDTYISYTNKTANKATQILSKLGNEKRYVMTKCIGGKNTGDVIITDGKCPNGSKVSNCNTVHSFQGVSVKEPNKLFINRDVAREPRVAQTAIGRAESMNQIYIVNNEVEEEEYYDEDEPNIPDDYWENEEECE